jgi:transposase
MRTIGRTRLRCFALACLGADRGPRTTAASSEALHFFAVKNVRWRALPERFGHWNSVWKRFDRLSKAGVFEAFFDALAAMSSSAHLIQMFDSTIVRACIGGWSKGGQEGQALGRSRGGFTTKIHAKSDASGDIIAFDLTGGEAFDGRHFETLLGIGPDIQPRVVMRQRLRQQRQPRGGEGARHCSRDPPQSQRKEHAGLLCTGPLQGPRPHRAGRRTAQALQAGRATLPKDRPKLQINRLLRRRPMLNQICPHGLASCENWKRASSSSRSPHWLKTQAS